MSSGDIDTAGMATSADPIAGGVVILNAAVPPGHPDHELWRAPSNSEIRDGRVRRRADAAQRASLARAHLRLERNRLLNASDWTQVPDAPLTPEQVDAFRAWRQTLRDFTIDGLADPDNPPPFPEPPATAPPPLEQGAPAPVVPPVDSTPP